MDDGGNNSGGDGGGDDDTPLEPVLDDDADVGCIPLPSLGSKPPHALRRALEEMEYYPEELAVHPGPFPVNAYRQSFFKSLEEIFFPPSLPKIKALHDEVAAREGAGSAGADGRTEASPNKNARKGKGVAALKKDQ